MNFAKIINVANKYKDGDPDVKIAYWAGYIDAAVTVIIIGTIIGAIYYG